MTINNSPQEKEKFVDPVELESSDKQSPTKTTWIITGALITTSLICILAYITINNGNNSENLESLIAHEKLTGERRTGGRIVGGVGEKVGEQHKQSDLEIILQTSGGINLFTVCTDCAESTMENSETLPDNSRKTKTVQEGDGEKSTTTTTFKSTTTTTTTTTTSTISIPPPLSFFGKSEKTFESVKTSKGPDHHISCQEFLDACQNYLIIYDLIGGSMFSPIKNDVSGNINKLKGFQKCSKGSNLLDLVQTEIEANTTHKSHSATDALLWLKRGLWMLYYFFEQVVATEGAVDAKQAFSQAYDQSLAKHHNFAVKIIIKAGLRAAAPSFDQFTEKVCAYKMPNDKNPEAHCRNLPFDQKKAVVLKELEKYIKPMKEVLSIIDDFYAKNGLPE